MPEDTEEIYEFDEGALEPELLLRPGLTDALARRASFSRRHVGSFAAPRAGNGMASASAPASWHSGDRVDFAWHQGEDVVFARFDRAGNVVIAPQPIGRGQWPQVSSDGAHAAVAWSGAEQTIVRIHDGEAWQPEMQLNGLRPDIVHAPDGVVYVGTTSGMFRSTAGGFEQIDRRGFDECAIGWDGSAPIVAFRRDQRIFCGETDLGSGQHPCILVTNEGIVHVAYVAGTAIVMRTRDGGRWSEARSLAPSGTWPALARGAAEEIRLTFLTSVKEGADALWMLRLPDTTPVLVPSVAGNVTAA
ncbi:MAG TPA: hypothetical protein VMN03_00125, partial [Burkholderiales bacterium]|nr:hypothetical protein [Burkholderiales bacterium]